jgi:hypothetical protein
MREVMGLAQQKVCAFTTILGGLYRQKRGDVAVQSVLLQLLGQEALKVVLAVAGAVLIIYLRVTRWRAQ